MTMTHMRLPGPSGVHDRARALFAVAQALIPHLSLPETITRHLLCRLMQDAFGVSDVGGLWTMRDAYDALEAAQVVHIARAARLDVASSAEQRFRELLALQQALPTQTYRSEHQIDLQQFSTPLALCWLAARAAQITASDHVLEPSAGNGMLAAHAATAGARLTLNERDPLRAALLTYALNVEVSQHDAEFINDLLPAEIRPTVVLINPPFSRSEGRGMDRAAGGRHLRSALQRLAPAGRCVAIMPPGFAADGNAARAYDAVAALVPPRAEITILGSPFAKHGTGVAVRLIVYDKGWSGQPLRLVADDLSAALDPVLSLAPRLKPRAGPIIARSFPLKPQPSTNNVPALLARPAPRLVPPLREMADTAPPQPIAYNVRGTPRAAGEAAGIYAPWRLARIDIKGAGEHPDQLVESVAMASVLPPAPTYRPLLQSRAVKALSEAQLETIILAGEAFERDLSGRFRPNPAGDQLLAQADGAAYRTGFFIGDGTGVGKGREAAGCILDQWNRGRRRAIWISKSASLLEDARRDWSALGGLPIDIQPLDVFPLGQPITMASGILFLTYATLRSSRHDQCSRLQQLLEWTGSNFDGVILFDESHAMGNAAGTQSEHGSAKGSEQGLAGVRLQNALPRARIVYVSATGATKPENLSYASRLGLWGPGTAFDDRAAFMAAMEGGGIAAMEIVARDLKAMGLYTARALSFAGVEYDPLEHRLTADQIEIYDAYADAWAIIHRNLDEALKASNIVDRMTGATLNAQAKGSALSRFESSKQRFFSQLLIAMKMPTVLRAIEAETEAGNVAVVQLVTTAEAILDRRLADLPADARAGLDLDLSPRETMIDCLKSAFPTRQMRVVRTSDNSLRSEPVVDELGNAVQCLEAVAARDELIEQLCAMPPIPAALDALIAHFGTAQVAEVTGRSRRIVADSTGRQKIERRSSLANIAETQAFMDGQKSILVFSDAGGTGRSYHADLGCKSAHRRRIHFLLEPGWRADVAIQGLGRTHRTNQVSPPIFRPVTTDCKGERRFISTIARRLDSLGALTRGQRQTGGQNLFDPADNLESDYAREALTQWYHLLSAGKLASTTMAVFQAITGLKHTDENQLLLDKLPPIQRWLNRILALRISTQNAIFDEYIGLIEARVDAAREAGTLDVGVETIRAERIVPLSEDVLRTDPLTGATTRLLRVELHLRPRTTSWGRLLQLWGETEIAFLRNARSGRIALRVPSWSITDAEGRPVPMCRLVRPTTSSRTRVTDLAHSHWHEMDRDTFRELWEAEIEESSRNLEIQTITAAAGLLLPVWNKLPDDDVRVWRIDDGRGTSILGRLVAPAAVEKLQEAFGIAQSIRLTPEEVIDAARHGDGSQIPGMGGGRLVSALVNGSRRLELRDFPPARLRELKALGCFSEVIAYKTRLFLPPDDAARILAALAQG